MAQNHLRAVLILLLCLLLAAWVSAATYYVSPTGDDTHPGSQEQPWKTITHAAAFPLVPGALVLVSPGTYPDRVFVAGAGAPGLPITFRASPIGGAIITGDVRPETWPGDDAIGGAHAHGWITWEGFKFHGVNNLFQLRAASDWRIISNVFEKNRNAINIRGDRVLIASNTFRDLTCHAFVIYGSDATTVINNQIRRTNLSGLCDPAASSVNKAGYTTNLRMTKNIFADNRGPGIWLDFQNVNYAIVDNDVYRSSGRTAAWQGPGISTEINEGPGLIADNRIEGCTGPGIAVLESAHVTVRNNTIEGGYAGIELRNNPRGPRIRQVLIEGNTISHLVPVPGTRTAGIKFAVGDPAPGGVTSKGNTFAVGAHAWYDWFAVRVFNAVDACTRLGFECP